MRKLPFFGGLLALALAGSVHAEAAGAQVRDVVSKEISVARSEASLRLGLSGGEQLDLTLRDGAVTIDDRSVGSYEPGGPLDMAWRSLLGQAVALENGPLTLALRDWAPPEGLSADAAEAARGLDRALEQALTAAQPGVDVSVDADADKGALERLLAGSLARLSVIEEALEGLDRIQVHIEEEYELPAGETASGTVVVIDGAARIGGEIDGHLVVIDGSVELLEGSRISGELRLADARVLRNLGSVEAGVVDVTERDRGDIRELREEIRQELRDEMRGDLRREIRNAARADRDDGFSLLSPFGSILRGIGGLLEKAILVLVMGLIGAAALSFAGDNVEVVAETARRAPGRAAMVGIAGTILLIPAWVLGAVALAVSIVGIPVAIAWIPLFPIAACVAALFGYLAVAKNVGEWLADSGYAWTDWVRKSNAVHTMVAGLVGLMLAFMAADVVSIAPFLGFLSGLLGLIGVLLTLVVTQIGFGAVLLTRAGRRRESWSTLDPDEAWAAAMDLEDEPVTEPTGAGRGFEGPSGSGGSGGSAGPTGPAGGPTDPSGPARPSGRSGDDV